jgi:hypothetical protein
LRVLALLLKALTYALAVRGLGLIVATLAFFQRPEVFRRDFVQDYLWVRAVADGADPYQPVATLGARYLGDIAVDLLQHPTPHPPTMGLLLLPLASLDIRTASTVWLVVELVCLVASIAVLAVRLHLPRPRLLVPAVSLALINWDPILADLVNGQATVPILLLVTLSWSALASGHLLRSGALLGLSFCLKPIALPIALVYITSRSRGALVGMLIPPVLLLTLAALRIGWPAMIGYIAILSRVNDLYGAAAGNISAWSIGRRVFEGTRSPAIVGVTAPPLVAWPAAAAGISIILLTALVVYGVWVTLKADPPAHAFGPLCCLCILLSPIAWDHYCVVAILSIALMLPWLSTHRLSWPQAAVTAAAGLLLLISDDVWSTLAVALDGQYLSDASGTSIQFLPATLMMMPTVGLIMLTGLAGWVASKPKIRIASYGLIPSRAARTQR